MKVLGIFEEGEDDEDIVMREVEVHSQTKKPWGWEKVKQLWRCCIMALAGASG